MEYVISGLEMFLRLEPGAKLVASLSELAEKEKIDFATITSGVGMVNGLTLGFFCLPENDYDTRTIDGIHDLSSISGNIALYEGKPRPHVHIVVNAPDYGTVSGHLIECTTHITMEIGLRVFPGSGLRRMAEPGRPATFITRR